MDEHAFHLMLTKRMASKCTNKRGVLPVHVKEKAITMAHICTTQVKREIGVADTLTIGDHEYVYARGVLQHVKSVVELEYPFKATHSTTSMGFDARPPHGTSSPFHWHSQDSVK